MVSWEVIFFFLSRMKNESRKQRRYTTKDRMIDVRFDRKTMTVSRVHPRSDPATAIGSFVFERTAKRRRKIRLIPISAGTTATESAANVTPLSRAMNRKAMMMVDGSVPMTPPVFVPYFSAVMVTRMTTSADKTKGMIVW